MESVTRNVTLKGIRSIMFDRFPGTKTEVVPTEQKMYLDKEGGLIIPNANIMSFLCATNTDSCAKRFYDPRKYKNKAAAILSYVTVDPMEAPLIGEKGKQIKWTGVWGENNIWRHYGTARLAKGIPNEKERPVVDCPWSIDISVRIWQGSGVEITESELRSLFEQGGIAIGLGTYRGVFGKFVVDKWE